MTAKKPAPPGVPADIWRRRRSIAAQAYRILRQDGPAAAEEFLGSVLRHPAGKGNEAT